MHPPPRQQDHPAGCSAHQGGLKGCGCVQRAGKAAAGTAGIAAGMLKIEPGRRETLAANSPGRELAEQSRAEGCAATHLLQRFHSAPQLLHFFLHFTGRTWKSDRGNVSE